MTSSFVRALFATTALTLALPTAARAEDAAKAPVAGAEGDIIVNARRSDERLQDVPVSVQAIGGEQLQKMAITRLTDISKLAPGLQLSGDQVTLRGVTWRPGSGTAATPIYINEMGFDIGQIANSIFDIGQIEVLRGPQGTSRGAPSISGAVTITTKKPNLNSYGGYAQALYGEANHLNLQGGINVPLIKDKLAVRFAFNLENGEGNRVYSIFNPAKPKSNQRDYRLTVLYQPTDNFNLQAMYQRRDSEGAGYAQVVGTGSPGGTGGGGLGAIPANFNGPALTVDQRASVQDAPATSKSLYDFITINANWDVLGHKLSYNFGKQIARTNVGYNNLDQVNMLPGFDPLQRVPSAALAAESTYTVHELRLSSMPEEGRFFDYDIGWYSKHSQGNSGQSFRQYLPGAFGGPTAKPGSVTSPNLTYTLPLDLNIGLGQIFDSFYGDVKFHIGSKTELAGGLAFIRDRVPVTFDTVVGAGRSSGGFFLATQAAFTNALSPLWVGNPASPTFGLPVPATCEAADVFLRRGLFTSTVYPGTCDVNVPAGTGQPLPQRDNDLYRKTIYNISLSHKFTDDLMVYFTTGSSYRSGLPALGSVGLPAGFSTPRPENGTSYELGVKSSWGRRFHANAAVYQINYKDRLQTFQGVQYWNSVASKVDLTSLAFYRNVDSRVRGFEIEIGAQPIDGLTLGANLAYSQIKSLGGIVPANAGACAGAVAVTALNRINSCTSPAGEVLNQDAPLMASVNGGYTMPVGNVNGYLRFNVSFKGENPNYGNYSKAGVFKPTPAYAIVDLFAGIAGERGAWDVGVYAKNVFNTKVELARYAMSNNIYSPYAVAPSGYEGVQMSIPREIGVTLRYAFGSR